MTEKTYEMACDDVLETMSDTCESWDESSESEYGDKVKDLCTNNGEFITNILFTYR